MFTMCISKHKFIEINWSADRKELVKAPVPIGLLRGFYGATSPKQSNHFQCPGAEDRSSMTENTRKVIKTKVGMIWCRCKI